MSYPCNSCNEDDLREFSGKSIGAATKKVQANDRLRLIMNARCDRFTRNDHTSSYLSSSGRSGYLVAMANEAEYFLCKVSSRLAVLSFAPLTLIARDLSPLSEARPKLELITGDLSEPNP